MEGFPTGSKRTNGTKELWNRCSWTARSKTSPRRSRKLKVVCPALISSGHLSLFYQLILCIPFVREVEESYHGPHLIFTNMGDGENPAYHCFSYVGLRDEGNGQVINLGSPGCLAVGVIIHEVLHALGKQNEFIFKLFSHFKGSTHEIMRADRDSYVKVLLENLEPGTEHNFLRKGTDLYSTKNTPFDYDSIMMYGPTDFGILDSGGQRMTTILPHVSGAKIR